MDKPRLILTPVNEICVYDVMLLDGELITITKMSRGAQQTYIRYGDQRYAWLNNTRKYYAQTSLQTYARSPRGRQLLGADARGTWQTPDAPSAPYAPRLDAGQRAAPAPGVTERSGHADTNHSNIVPHIQQSRATVCMTLGKNLKHGDYVAVRVVEVPESKSKGLMLPNGILLVTSERYYDKVN